MEVSAFIENIQRDSAISFPMLGLTIDPPSYFTVFGHPIYFYGVLIGLGFILGILYCAKRSSEFGVEEDDLYDILIWLIPFSIIGARLYHVMFDLEYYMYHLSEIVAIWEGGLAIYGGIIAGILVVLIKCRHKKIPVLAFLDLLIFGLLIGQIIGRWGNFLNREAFGVETTVPWRMGLISPNGTTVYVHPTFLYESLWNFGTFIFLVVWTRKGRRKYDGQCLLIYFLLYGIGRAWIEGIRTDALYIFGTNIRISQLVSVMLAAVSLVILIIQSRREHSPEELYVNRKAAEPEPHPANGDKAEDAPAE